MTRNDVGGVSHRISWGETSVRFNPHLRARISYTNLPTMDMMDEAYLAGESGLSMVRVGRFRTAFGISDWSDLLYNGFNRLPLVRMNGIVNGLRLNRDDTGVEATVAQGRWQAQVSLVDTQSSFFQFEPREIRHGSVRVQGDLDGVLVGFNVLKRLDGVQDVYGIDARWGMPHLMVRGEAMQGIGGDRTAWGYYLDAAYRLPRLAHTQVVARTERLSDRRRGDASLHTVGVRQVVLPELTVNLNYGWARRSEASFTPIGASTGFTVQTMFQIRF